MEFEGWPDIHDQCPACERTNCATYQGYFKRNFQCSELEVVGLLVIRTFFCKHFQIRFSLIPSFVTPYKIMSAETVSEFIHAFKKSRSIVLAIDDVCEDLDEQFYFAFSTVSKLIRDYLPMPP